MTQMKDSGVKWIGQVPENWKIKQIRHLMIERNEKNENLQTATMLSLSAKEGVTLYSEEGHTGNRPREDLSGYKVVKQGDIVVNSMNILSGAVGLSKFEGCVSPVYYTYYAREGYDINFLNLVFQSKQFQLNLKGLGNGILIKESENGNLNTIRMRIPSDKLLKEEFPICSLECQKKIVKVIGNKCEQIDKLIEIQEKEIEKLKEYRTSVITKAVTKGLDESVSMKDSGIDWMGQIPSHWRINKLKFVSKLITDGTHQTPNYIDQGIPFLSIKDISSGKINFEDAKYISQEEHELLYKHAPIEKGDLIFTRIGTLGVFVLVDIDEIFDIFVSVGLVKFKDDISSMQKKYIIYFLSSNSFLDYINLVKAGGGTSAAKFNLEDVRESVFTMPEATEMKTILQFLDSKCSKIDNIIEKKNQKIEKLKEYKKSLIYEYVTGKKQVND